MAWKQHLYRVGPGSWSSDEPPPDAEIDKHRQKIEPWLSAVFQTEHLSLLVGNGLTTAAAFAAGVQPASMKSQELTCQFASGVNAHAEKMAKQCGRGSSNIEDQLRAILQLIAGLEIIGAAAQEDAPQEGEGKPKKKGNKDSSPDPNANAAKCWENALNEILTNLVGAVVGAERGILGAEARHMSDTLLVSFLMSFASRTATRDRLNVFTTNYDRVIEYACDLAGIHVVDRFVGTLTPEFRSSRIEVDLHYNPPGIRGEPRYLEGVIRMSKLHGSVDWRWENKTLRRYGVPFGAPGDHPYIARGRGDSVIIYPNAAKDVETLEYPYAELFRDFAAALCRPNSALVTFGYGFGDDHVNRTIRDMLTIPSTHLVAISFDDVGGRLPQILQEMGHDEQITLLVGNHFGALPTLVKYYLPKPAIDPITSRMASLVERRSATKKQEGDADKQAPDGSGGVTEE